MALTLFAKLSLLFIFITIISPVALYNIARAIVRAYAQRFPIRAAIENAVGRAFMAYVPPAYIQDILPSTFDTYYQWTVAHGIEPEIETVPDGKTRLLWLGARKTDKVLLFFHGGGYVMPLSDAHLDWMAYTQQRCFEAGLNVGIVILEYKLIPEYPYPCQMNQAVAAFKTLIASGYSPGDMIIGGDSAGGHLSLSLLSHLHRPRPDGDLRVQLQSKLRGCFIISPLLSLNDFKTSSYLSQSPIDVLCEKVIREWGDLLINDSPGRDEIKKGLGWGMALDVPEKWWRGLNVVDRILVTAGHEEHFRDHVIEFIDVLRRNATEVNVSLYMAMDEAHDGPLMDFRAHQSPGNTTQILTDWVVATFSVES